MSHMALHGQPEQLVAVSYVFDRAESDVYECLYDVDVNRLL